MLSQQIQHMEKNIPEKIHELMNSESSKNNNDIQNTTNFVDYTLNNSTICNGETKNAHIVNDIKSCKKVLFNDPEIPSVLPVTSAEFNKIPKYIIGRYTLDALNSLALSINQVIKSKYSIIALGKNGARKKGELDLYLHYKKEQMSLGSDEGKFIIHN